MPNVWQGGFLRDSVTGALVLSGSGGGGSAPTVAATVAELGNGTGDGDLAVIALASGHDELVRWDATDGRWVGEPLTVKAQGDTWAMGLDDYPAFDAGWNAIRSAIYAGTSRANSDLTVSVDLSSAAFAGGTGVLTVTSTNAAHGPAFVNVSGSGQYYRVRDNYLTGAVGSSTTLTGCKLIQGTGGVIPIGEMVVQGDEGGWGFTDIEPVVAAAELWQAGLRPEVSLVALLNSGFGVPEKKFTVGAYWFEYDHGDGTTPRTSPISGGLGVFPTLQSLAGTGGTGGGERSFYMTVPQSGEWAAWTLAAPTKPYLVPVIVGVMEAGAQHPGSVLDLRLRLRWASP